MISLFFYNLALLFSTLFIWLSEKVGSVGQKFFCIIVAFLILLLPAALRYEIGIDYFSYKIIFENIRDGFDPFLQSEMEPGYYFLNWLVAKLGGEFELLIVLISFLITTFFFKSYPNKHKAIYHLVLWGAVYFETFNTLRSMLAGAILLYAVMSYSRNGKLYSYTLWVLLAVTFHKSAFLFFFIPFLSQKRLIRNFAEAKIIFPLLIIVSVLFGRPIIEFIFNSSLTATLGFSNYINSWYDKDTELGTGLGVLLTISFFIYTLVVVSKPLERKNSILIVVILFSAISIVLASYVAIFYRVKLLFIIGFPLAAFLILDSSKSQFSIAVIIMFVALILFDFNRSILNGSTNYMETCRGARITPYVSVFNREDSIRDPDLTRFAHECDVFFENK